MAMTDSKIFRQEGTKMIASYPSFNHAAKLYSGYTMGKSEAIRALFNLIPELADDCKRADLDLFVHLDLQERRIDGIITKRDKDLKTTNENFRIHRELIDGFTEIFDNQQREIDGLWKVINRMEKKIDNLTT